MPARDVVERNKKDFPPGSETAETEGCTCSKVDNQHGKGYLGHKGTWMIRIGCPLHYCEAQAIKTKRRKSSEEDE